MRKALIYYINRFKSGGLYIYQQVEYKKLHILPTECNMYVVCGSRTTNSEYFPTQHSCLVLSKEHTILCEVGTVSLL